MPKLLNAVLFGSFADVKSLISSEGRANVSGQDGFTPLMSAAVRGDSSITAYLIEKGADVNQRNDIGQTALMIAAKGGHKSILEQLVSAGADPTARDKEERNAIAWATSEGDFPEVISFLIAVGADYNTPDIRGLTPLMNAAMLDRAQTIAILLTAGADENIKYRGKTAYDMAHERGYKKVCKIMLSVLENRPKRHSL